MTALAVVLIAIGALLVARAVPPETARRWATSTTAVGGALVLVLGSAIAAVLAHHEPARPRAARPDQAGVCAAVAVQPRCAELYAAAASALDVLASAPLDAGATRPQPQLTVPGSGDLYLVQTVTTTAAPGLMSGRLVTAFTGTGWSPLPDQQGLLRFQRARFTAVVRITPAGAGSRVELTVSRAS